MTTRRPSHPRPPSSGSVLAAAALLAVVAVLMPGAAPTIRAAEDDLRLSADATYRVVPADGEVRVRVDWKATNLQPNTVRRTPSGILTTRYFYDRLLFTVPIEAREIRATSGGGRLSVSTRDLEFSRQVTVRIPNLYYRQSRSMRVDFVLPGGKPRSDSDVRVGRAFTTFTAWAWGDANRGAVRIILPSGFDAEGYGDDVTQRTYDDRVELTSGRIADPLDWYRVVVADRPTQLTQVDVDTGGRKIVVRAWPEDVTWRERVSDVLTDGLPELEKMIGRP
ncbi:MAG TPA: hypothetical protein VIB02_11165, partial [Candidatus Limnocylindrales bacterium]